MNSSEQFDDLLEKKISGLISPDEEKELSKILSENEDKERFFQKISALDKISGNLIPVAEFDGKKGFDRFQKTLANESVSVEKNAKVLSLNSTTFISIAASIVVVIGVSWYFLIGNPEAPQQYEVSTLKGETKEVTLPDGSVVVLNQSSSLNYPKNFLENERNVLLEGEAFFKVVKDPNAPFKVVAGHTLTEVLGTSFNINTNKKEQVSIDVFSGKVSFSQKNSTGKAVVLIKEQSAVIKLNQKASVKEVSANALSWKSNKLSFEEARLATVAEDISNHFGVEIDIVTEGLGGCLFTSEFNQPVLEDVLEELELTMGISVFVKEKIIMKGNPCL